MHKRNNKIFFKSCNICNSKNIKAVINLGYHLPADTFINKVDLNKYIPKIKLICKYCSQCSNIQLSNTLAKQFLYNNFKYSYRSGNSLISKKYWENYFQFIINKINIARGTILEIGTNDGYLLKKFPKKNFNLNSYEISKEMNMELKNIGIKSKNYAFEDISKKEIKTNQNKYDVIIANNVLNHSQNINVFFKNIYSLLSPNGYFFLEVPYSPWMIKKNKFELIYLEHSNYFSLVGLNMLAKKNKLFVNDINFFDYHGKMIRLIITKKNSENKKIKKIILNEINFFNSKSIFLKFTKNIEKKKYKFLKKVNLIKKSKDSIIVGVSAGAKTSSFLNTFNLNSNQIDFLTDNSKFKIGKYIPLKNIEIKPDSFLKNKKNIYVFFPTWNIADYLRKKILKLNKNIKFINY